MAIMQLFLILLASVVSAVVVPERVERVLQPGEPVKRMVANGGPYIVNGVVNGVPVEVRVALSAITEAPVPGYAASSEGATTSGCTPRSICFDGITCSQRYGA